MYIVLQLHAMLYNSQFSELVTTTSKEHLMLLVGETMSEPSLSATPHLQGDVCMVTFS